MLWLQSNWGIILAVIVGIDTALAEIPAIKANSTFQLITSFLMKLAGK